MIPDETTLPPAARTNCEADAEATLAPTSARTASSMPTIPGCELKGELGRGGMGVVYRAYQPHLRRHVAIKMLLSGSLAHESERERFRTEIEAAGSLQHPNIVRVFEVGEIEGRPYYSMEFVDGQSLSQRLGGGPLDPIESARIVATIAMAIQCAHERGLLHRDLKPGNILLSQDGRPMVTDFGLAKNISQTRDDKHLTATGAALGTPNYMAPEQAAGRKELTAATDVYGLGAVLYECLTGRPPFRAATPIDTLLQVMENEPAPPRLVNPNVPRDLETICLKCLEKDPKRRYASAAHLAADLNRFIADEPISARSLNLVQRLARALERDQNAAQFATYGTMFLWLAPLMALPEVLITLIALNDWPQVLLPITQFGRAFAFVLLVRHYRGGSLLPQGPNDRLICSVWGGYLVTCFALGLSQRAMLGWGSPVETRLYPALSCLTALAFFATGSGLWGWCYAFGAVFLVLPFLMIADLRWSALEFAAVWFVTLTMVGLRLRRLAKPQAAA